MVKPEKSCHLHLVYQFTVPLKIKNAFKRLMIHWMLSTILKTSNKSDEVMWSWSIITSRIGGGWVSAFFVMLRDGKQGRGWVVTSWKDITSCKKDHKAFFCTIVKRSGFHQYRTLMVSSLVSMVIAFFAIILYLSSFL